MAGLAHKLYTVIELLSKRRKEENWNGIIVVCLEIIVFYLFYLLLFLLLFICIGFYPWTS